MGDLLPSADMFCVSLQMEQLFVMKALPPFNVTVEKLIFFLLSNLYFSKNHLCPICPEMFSKKKNDSLNYAKFSNSKNGTKKKTLGKFGERDQS